jgi:hypothetical protein
MSILTSIKQRWPFSKKFGLDNIYHCCTQKTASQWIRRIFSDEKTVGHYTGLESYQCESQFADGVDARRLDERRFHEPFPRGTVVTPLYISYECFAEIPKPERYKGFFVMRDPRDIVVSRYFSFKLSHRPSGTIPTIREHLNQVDEPAGLEYVIAELDRRGLFAALRSWQRPLPPEMVNVRYEDLIGDDQFEKFQKLMSHCEIEMPKAMLRDVLRRNSFQERSGGRAPGEEDPNSHLRKGVAGDWKNHFTESVERAFRQTTGNLVDELGYAW